MLIAERTLCEAKATEQEGPNIRLATDEGRALAGAAENLKREKQNELG
jgi:hypothetical protein